MIGIDTGGTFTDLVYFAGHELHVHKVLSTPSNPARAVLQGLRELLASVPRVRNDETTITYGSTVATNAVLERKGARVVLLTTAGFEDLLEIGRQTRPDLYALEPRKPEPLVPRPRRVGVRERMTFEGRVLAPLRGKSLAAAAAAVRRLRGRSVAVCLLHAYANPVHERALGDVLRRLGVPCSLSHELVAEFREYERLSTTVLNAYVAPVMRQHLAELERGVGTQRLRVLQSTGGVVSVPTAAREAVRTLLSGPAGGVVGAMAAAKRLGLRRLITFDMGGTSTDVSLIDGERRVHTEWHIADLPVKVPAIDIHTVGAGGGSLAYADAGGALKVGPESAGADPGPACYGRGEAATVTDANVVLGRLVPSAFLGGRMRLDGARAQRALAALARSLPASTDGETRSARRHPALRVEEAAEGVVRVVNASMERAIRRISVERGHDPRRYTLVAFGGAAGLHACALAGSLQIRHVLIPHQPGLLSALGAVSADVQRDYVQTVRLVDPSPVRLSRRVAPLQRRARRDLAREAGRGIAIRVDVALECRYQGQSYEICVPLTRAYRGAFHRAHRRLYGYAEAGRPVEVVNLRVVATARSPRLPRVRIDHEPFVTQPHRIRWNGRWRTARCARRRALPFDRRLAGPLVITEFSATTLVPPGWTARATAQGDLLLEARAQRALRR